MAPFLRIIAIITYFVQSDCICPAVSHYIKFQFHAGQNAFIFVDSINCVKNHFGILEWNQNFDESAAVTTIG